MEPDELVECDVMCEICEEYSLIVHQDDYVGYYWCPNCGALSIGSDATEAWYIKVPYSQKGKVE